MADKTAIAWTDHTFNALWGCVKVSPGCKNCYAEGLADRYGHDVWGKSKTRRTFGDNHWNQPRKWSRIKEPGVLGTDRPRLVFCGSMFDVFEDHPTVQAEREKLTKRDEKNRNFGEQQVQRFQVLRRLLEEVVASVDKDYVDLWIASGGDEATLSVEEFAKGVQGTEWRITPNYTSKSRRYPDLESVSGFFRSD